MVAATSELNSDLARLKANASNMGFDYKNIEAGFRKVAAVTGETDSAVETLSNLMQTGFSEVQMAQVINDINGAAIRFSDTLKTEGIADGIQETFATGKAIGMFGELLERSGVDLEKFNEGLAKAQKSGSETDYVLQQLADLGLASAYEEYKKINPEIAAATEASTNLEIAFANFGLALNPFVTKIKEVTTAFLEWITNSPTIQNAMTTINNVINSFDPSSMTSGFASIKEAVTNAFEFIQPYVMKVLTPVVDFVQQQVQKIVSFWQENGQQIIQAVKNAFEGIKAVVDFVMPAVLFAIDFVWTAIKQVISGALDVITGLVKVFTGLFTGDFEKMWEGVKDIFKGAIDLILGVMSLTFVGGIRTAITNLAKTVITAIKTKWTTITSLFQGGATGVINLVIKMASSVFNAAKSLATNFVNTIVGLKNNVVTKFTEIKTAIINTVKGIDLVKIGKEVVNGLIIGIGNMFANVKGKISELANLIPDWTKKVLGIKSPSRIMMELGEWIGIGLADGIKSTESLNEKIMKDLTRKILDVKEDSKNKLIKIDADLAKAIEKANQTAEDKILKIQQTASKKKQALTAEQTKQIQRIRQDATDAVTKLEEKAVADRTKIAADEKKLVEEHYKALFESVKTFVDNKKSLNQMTITDEATVWRETMNMFTEGSEQRIKAQQEYQKVTQEIQKQLADTNKHYSDEFKKISDEQIKQEETLTKAYEDAVNKRSQSLYSFKNLFDEFKHEIDVTGEELLVNLGSQVEGFKEWQREVETLSHKAIDEGLLAELREMGPNALPQLKALNSLTSDQLQRYSNLYKEKSKLARTQAETELIGMKNDTDKQIKSLREAANKELTQLEREWSTKIKSITSGTQTQLMTLTQIGTDAARGLLSGLSSMEGELYAKARAMADNISRTMKEALQVKSPSRLTKEIGVNVGEGLIVGMDEMISKVEQSSNRLADTVGGAYISLSSGKAKSEQSKAASSSTINNSKYMQPSITIINQVQNASPSEIARKALQVQRQLALEWGV